MYLLELAGQDDRFAIAEAALACHGLNRLAPGIASADGVDQDLAGRLALTHAVLSSVVEVEGDLDDLEAAMRAVTLERRGTVAVRATAVRGEADIDVQLVERRIGQILVDRGFDVDLDSPDLVLRILATGGIETGWYGGWVTVEPERSYGARRPPMRPFRQPGTMRPQLARALVNLSGIDTGEILLDPMCGAGAILTEAALVGVQPVGVDIQPKMVEGARENVEAFASHGPKPLFVRGSAARLPIRRADAAVFDAPYGRQSPIGFESAQGLVRATLSELYQVVDTCVVVFDRPLDDLMTSTGWVVVDRFERRVHRSLTRHIAVLNRRS